MKDLSGNNHITSLLAELGKVKQRQKEDAQTEKEIRIELINFLNKEEVDSIKCNDFILQSKFIEGKEATPDRVITHKDIGEVIKGDKGRKGSYRLTVKEVKND